MKQRMSIFSLVLAFVMCLGVAMPAWADGKEETKIVEVNGYSFEIQERTNDNFSVERTYTKPSQMVLVNETNNINDNKLEEAKALLIALGMDEKNVNLWEDESLLIVANGKDVTVTEAYYAVNDQVDTVTPVSAEVAISESATQAMLQSVSDISPYASNPYEDSYIRVYQAAVYQGSAKYLFSTDSLWLKMPRTRSYDSLGSCAQLTAVVPNSNIGSWSYDVTTVIDEVAEEDSVYSKQFKKENFASDGGWAGAAGVFLVPGDINSSDGNSVTYTNFRAHYEYQGIMNDPDNTNQNFNSKGTYAHSTKKLSVVPSIGISSDLSGSIGISISSSTSVETYTAVILKNYTG